MPPLYDPIGTALGVPEGAVAAVTAATYLVTAVAAVAWAYAGDRFRRRPLLVVGRGGDELIALMLSSQHDRADDPDWMGIGAGAWDREGRASYVRLDRVIEVGEHDIRREGAVLDRERFERVADGLRSRHGWR